MSTKRSASSHSRCGGGDACPFGFEFCEDEAPAAAGGDVGPAADAVLAVVDVHVLPAAEAEKLLDAGLEMPFARIRPGHDRPPPSSRSYSASSSASMSSTKRVGGSPDSEPLGGGSTSGSHLGRWEWDHLMEHRRVGGSRWFPCAGNHLSWCSGEAPGSLLDGEMRAISSISASRAARTSSRRPAMTAVIWLVVQPGCSAT